MRKLYDAFARRDLAAIFNLFARDVELVQSTEVPWGGIYRGHEQAAQFFAGLTQHVTTSVVFERFIDAGDHVVAVGRTQGTVNATAARFDVPIAHIWELRDGQVMRGLFCIDNPTLQAALAAPGAR
ncbi:MAG: nuclear transport factor 2 family protein [Candidatus Binatia bacterium]